MEIIFARHCQTAWNAVGRIQGTSDIPLNAEGRRQAKDLAKRLSAVKISKVYSSHLSRAIETAQNVKNSPLGFVILDMRLRECDFGALNGMTKEDVDARYGPTFWKELKTQRGWADDYSFADLGGENRAQVLGRQLAFLDELVAKSGNANDDGFPVVIGHGRSLGTLLHHLGHPTVVLEQGFYEIVRYPKGR